LIIIFGETLKNYSALISCLESISGKIGALRAVDCDINHRGLSGAKSQSSITNLSLSRICPLFNTCAHHTNEKFLSHIAIYIQKIKDDTAVRLIALDMANQKVMRAFSRKTAHSNP
jgi:hypothetical protein